MNRDRIVTVLLIVVLQAALPAPLADSGDEAPELARLSWMAGSWSAGRDGVEMEEYWIAPKGGVMLGLHRDVRETGGAFFEYLRIEQREAGVFYLASPAGREAVPFKLVRQDSKRAVFENAEHDYPNRIIYWRDGETLCARIEGRQKGQARSREWCWQRNEPDSGEQP